MGEYAYYKGERVKIGTCEDMLYLRWDQRRKVTKSETPLFDRKVLAVIRFRFPWPDEDHIEPGEFENPFRGFRLDGFEMPRDLEHRSTQFAATNQNGYLVMLPCPESGQAITGPDGKPIRMGLNGYGGPAELTAQAWRGGRLVGIAQCKGCGVAFRLEGDYGEAAAVSIRSRADEQIRTADLARGKSEGNRAIGKELHDIADRLLAGYRLADPS